MSRLPVRVLVMLCLAESPVKAGLHGDFFRHFRISSKITPDMKNGPGQTLQAGPEKRTASSMVTRSYTVQLSGAMSHDQASNQTSFHFDMRSN
jgi:hypothetical protein